MLKYFVDELNFQGVSGQVSFDAQRELEGTKYIVKPAITK